MAKSLTASAEAPSPEASPPRIYPHNIQISLANVAVTRRGLHPNAQSSPAVSAWVWGSPGDCTYGSPGVCR